MKIKQNVCDFISSGRVENGRKSTLVIDAEKIFQEIN